MRQHGGGAFEMSVAGEEGQGNWKHLKRWYLQSSDVVEKVVPRRRWSVATSWWE
jgi:hypothetical protein